MNDEITGSALADAGDVALLHRMLKCSIFGWPDGELEKAHALLDKIASAAMNRGTQEGLFEK